MHTHTHTHARAHTHTHTHTRTRTHTHTHTHTQLMEDTHDLAKVLHAALISSPPPYGGCSMEAAPEWGGEGEAGSSTAVSQ